MSTYSDFATLADNPTLSPKNTLAVATAILQDAGVTSYRQIRSALGARSQWFNRIVESPLATSDTKLAVLAHEAGHVATTRIMPNSKPRPRVEEEWQATLWGLNAIVRHGGEVTPTMREFLRLALASYMKSGALPPKSPEAYDFLQTGEIKLSPRYRPNP